MKTVVIRAVCIDDREVPHPASQVFPGHDVAEKYEGELYRCIAGTRLSVTVADWLGKVAFDGGTVITAPRVKRSITARAANWPAASSGRRVTATSARCCAATASGTRSSRWSASRRTPPTARDGHLGPRRLDRVRRRRRRRAVLIDSRRRR
jgi:hypothetical protein